MSNQEVAAALKIYQPGVGHLRSAEIQKAKLIEPAKMCQPGVGHLRFTKVQRFDIGQARKLHSPASAIFDPLASTMCTVCNMSLPSSLPIHPRTTGGWSLTVSR